MDKIDLKKTLDSYQAPKGASGSSRSRSGGTS